MINTTALQQLLAQPYFPQRDQTHEGRHYRRCSHHARKFTSFVLVNHDSPPCVSDFSFIPKISGRVEQLMAVVVKTLGHFCVMYFYQ